MKKILKPEQFAKWEEKQSDRKKNQSERVQNRMEKRRDK